MTLNLIHTLHPSVSGAVHWILLFFFFSKMVKLGTEPVYVTCHEPARVCVYEEFGVCVLVLSTANS